MNPGERQHIGLAPRVPSFRYTFTKPEIQRITDEIGELLREGRQLTLGAHGATLEEEFAQYTGVRHAVSVSSGTASLEIILRALDVAGGRVIVPTNTYGATPVAVLRAGAKPIFADAAADLSISVADTARRLTGDIRAVIAVHIGGLVSPNIQALAELCSSHGVPLVEDAAHAAGATLNGHHAGSFGIAAAFSLFSTKVMTSGDGGLIATNDDRIRNTALLLRDHAKNPDGTMSTTGYNWRLTEFQAVVARSQLRTLDEMIAARDTVARRYDNRLWDLGCSRILAPSPGVQPNRYKYVLFLDEHEPEAVRQILRDQHNVELGGYVYRTPCHQQAAFEHYAAGPYQSAERLCASHICLPIYPEMTEDDTDYVAQSLTAILTK